MYKNQAILAGFLGKKPELRHMPSGDAVTNVSLATKDFWRTSDQEKKERTEWHSLVFYGDLANLAVQWEKGDNIYVEGKIQTRSQEEPKRVFREIVVLSAHRIDRSTKREQSSPNEQPQEPHSPEGGTSSDNWPKV